MTVFRQIILQGFVVSKLCQIFPQARNSSFRATLGIGALKLKCGQLHLVSATHIVPQFGTRWRLCDFSLSELRINRNPIEDLTQWRPRGCGDFKLCRAVFEIAPESFLLAFVEFDFLNGSLRATNVFTLIIPLCFMVYCLHENGSPCLNSLKSSSARNRESPLLGLFQATQFG